MIICRFCYALGLSFNTKKSTLFLNATANYRIRFKFQSYHEDWITFLKKLMDLMMKIWEDARKDRARKVDIDVRQLRMKSLDP